MSDSKPVVMIAIPSGDGYVHGRLIQNLLPQLGDYPFCIVSGVSPVAKARNGIVKEFLASKCTHLLMVDADTIIPKDAVEKLLALDSPIASGITPTIQGDEVVMNIYREKDGKLLAYAQDDALPDADRMTVAAVGASCLMVKREVFEKMEKPPYFFDLWTQANQYISEDIMFCNLAKDLGYSIIVHPKVICKHERSVVI